MESKTGLLWCVLCLLVAPLILQGVGMFTHNWGSNSTCDSIGLIYSCCSGVDKTTCVKNVGNDLDARVLGLHATAFGMIFVGVILWVVWACFYIFREKWTGWCSHISGCSLVLYSFGALSSFIGCMFWVSRYSGSSLGFSFALSLTSACLIFLLATITMCSAIYMTIRCIPVVVMCVDCYNECKDNERHTDDNEGNGEL